MRATFATDAVGLPGLAALMVGLAAFAAAVLAARIRAARGEAETVAHKAPITWLWIVVQGLGIAATGFGPVRASLDPGSFKAIVEAAAVLALMSAAVALFIASSRAMGGNWALVARTRTDHTLVQTGPFARVRHPIYAAMFLLMIALAVASGHARNLIVGVPLFVLGTALRVAHEERLLKARFGPAYDAYTARVKRFVPGLF